MPVYEIAGVNLQICPPDEETAALLAPYRVETDDFDAQIPEGEGHLLASVSRVLLHDFSGIYFHAAAITYGGKAYLFCAPSGTGKSTHIALWKKLLGDKVGIINGDKPILRLVNGVPVVFDSPWRGKEGWGRRTSAPLGGIFFLERGEGNAVGKLPPAEALRRFLSATVYPKDAPDLGKLVDLFNQLNCPQALLTCRPDTEAVQTALAFLEEGWV